MTFRSSCSKVFNRDAIRIGVVIAGMATIATSTSAWAHHSAAMFDQSKTVEIKGAVKSWLWTNPHSFLVVTARDAAGVAADYSLEANGPGYLVRNGWKRDSLRPGDTVTITMNPLRDGSAGGNLVEVAFPDGRKLSARPTRAPAPPAPPAQ